MNSKRKFSSIYLKGRINIATIILIILLISFSIFALNIFFLNPSFKDPICDLANETFGMSCVPLASPGVYEKGAMFSKSTEDVSKSKYKFPIDYVLSDSCYSPYTDLSFAKFVKDDEKSVNFGKHSFSINKNLSVGIELNLPKNFGIKLQAGPKISEVKSVEMEAENAILFNIDSQKFIETLNSCAIKKSCISKAIKNNILIAKQILVAENLRYTITTTTGDSFPLSVAIKKGQIEFGGTSHDDSVSASNLSTGKDMVFAVNFFENEWGKQIDACNSNLFAYHISGQSQAKVFRDGFLIDEKDSKGDEEITTHHIYNLSNKERDIGEKYSFAEVR
ncbi:MAG: hypothetical protein R3250_17080, partial [Melioribacteraceae bacterium]|nr:hypothetical protein [Melioribacteraceae bacterium]